MFAGSWRCLQGRVTLTVESGRCEQPVRGLYFFFLVTWVSGDLPAAEDRQ